jgi:ABC-type antimicrobial peptide transport system permease subunit
LYLSSFEAAKVLKGTIKTNAGAALLRKSLVVFQFSLSVILIISTIVVYNQITYIKSKNLGYNKDNLLYLPVMGDILKSYDVFKNELLQEPGIMNVATSSQTIGQAGSNTTSLTWEGQAPGEKVLITHYLVDHDFIKTTGIELKEGRDFSREFSTDTSGVILNEEAVRRLGMKNPVGTRVKLDDEPATVIGVAKDFHSNSLHIPIEPAFIVLRPENAHTILVRIAAGKEEAALHKLEATHQKYNPAFPFEYRFMDETFDRLYKGETVIGKLANYFAFVAIFISCLGLFGLAAFTAEQRTREIGIRKVLGASESSITLLLSKDFLKLVLIAIFIAIPVACYAMHQWLQDFAYQVNIGIDVFILAGIAALTIALLTVSYQSIKAALSNPVKSLRGE